MSNDTNLIDGAAETGAVVAVNAKPSDLRHMMMSLPVDQQTQLRDEYLERRTAFREWLLGQLKEGLHYGIVPGCEPKTKEINGVINYGVWNKKANGGKGGYDWYPPTQWQPKPSLYAAGADFICDLMGVRDEYESDGVAWQQMGAKAGTSVQKCRLKSRATGELIGEAIGAYSHQYDANNACKMASKCAKVGAVINAYSLRDLFTQDEPPAPPHDNPPENPAAPKAQPRAKRESTIKPDVIADILTKWRGWHATGDESRDRELFKSWVQKVAGREMNALVQKQWTSDDVDKCLSALGHPTSKDEEAIGDSIPF